MLVHQPCNPAAPHNANEEEKKQHTPHNTNKEKETKAHTCATFCFSVSRKLFSVFSLLMGTETTVLAAAAAASGGMSGSKVPVLHVYVCMCMCVVWRWKGEGRMQEKGQTRPGNGREKTRQGKPPNHYHVPAPFSTAHAWTSSGWKEAVAKAV